MHLGGEMGAIIAEMAASAALKQFFISIPDLPASLLKKPTDLNGYL